MGDNLRRVGVGVILVAASPAVELGLRWTVFGRDVAAHGARLRRVGGGHAQADPAALHRLLGGALGDPRETAGQQLAVEPGFLGDVLAGCLDRTLGAAGHVAEAQVLKNHRARHRRVREQPVRNLFGKVAADLGGVLFDQ